MPKRPAITGQVVLIVETSQLLLSVRLQCLAPVETERALFPEPDDFVKWKF